jgi:hypothetical protein
MDWGGISFIDALAVRGIWKRHPPDRVLSAFDSVRDMAEDLRMQINGAYGGDLWNSLSANVNLLLVEVAKSPPNTLTEPGTHHGFGPRID